MNGEQRLVSNVSPTITRHDDGHLTIVWGTSDGTMPTLPILVAPELVAHWVEQHNELRADIDSLLRRLGQAFVDGRTIDREEQP